VDGRERSGGQGKGAGRERGGRKGIGGRGGDGKENGHRPPTIFGLKVALLSLQFPVIIYLHLR